MKTRLESDSLGSIEIPEDKLWGAVTQRSFNNFKIANNPIPTELIKALAIVKRTAAVTNEQLGVLDATKSSLIQSVTKEIEEGKLDEHFPLGIWQTGSGTHTNMNINEVISNKAQLLSGKDISERPKVLHQNDDVNKSQSSNDVFPTGIHIAVAKEIIHKTIPALEYLRNELSVKAKEFASIIKTGRTHMMDAVPLRLGDEFSAYSKQIDWGIKSLQKTLEHLLELPMGGTAVGSGLNAPKGYKALFCENLRKDTNIDFVPAENNFESMSSKGAIVEVQNALSQTATELFKIVNDIRMMASGPRTGLSELILPAKEPGSSIMPGKVNPTQVEAVQMACARIISNSVSNNIANMNGHFQLNTFMPLLAANTLESCNLMADISISFADQNIKELEINESKISENLSKSLMLVTALNTEIGYEKAAKIAQLAFKENLTLKEAALQLGHITSDKFDEIVDPTKMV